ncbi:MAG: hypothetical protein GF409_07205 [Candidatus Omnitrophica bacterium]|nr:hypothetical protein [Candidatus Omnitrophota bacterium]
MSHDRPQQEHDKGAYPPERASYSKVQTTGLGITQVVIVVCVVDGINHFC